MHKRLKSILRRSVGKTPEPTEGAHASDGHAKSNSPRINNQPRSSHSRDHPVADVANGSAEPLHSRRSVSSGHDSSAVHPSAVGNASGASKPDPGYNAPALAQNGQVEIPSDQHPALEGDSQPINGENRENSQLTAHGNVPRHGASIDENKRKQFGTDNSKLQHSTAGPIGSEQTNHNGNSRAPHTDEDSFASARDSISSSDYGETYNPANSSKQYEWPTSGINERFSKKPPSDGKVLGLSREEHAIEGGPVEFQPATKDGYEESQLHKQLRLDGVVDLTDTVDTDGDIKWAPAVTHEVVKPHQHEIVQHRVFREIHNYEYFHRIQPVMMTEVLPPRHWIPNPEGEGLIEISADELPARTGDNRWWSVVQHESPYSAQKTQTKWRTEPEIIERGMTTTAEGFERRETIIIHPPTLASLKDYSGPVQPVHFDHKTGKRWLGEMSTMEELRDLQKLLDSAPEAHAFQLNELGENLPKTSSSTMPKRKSVPGSAVP